MASRGVHCRDPGLKVAAWAEGPDVQNSSGWPCQCVLRSWPLHLLWPHSGWYIVTVPVGCLWCLGADGLPLLSPASPGGGRLWFWRSRPAVAEQSATPEALITVAANRTSGLCPSPAAFYCPIGVVIGRAGYGLLAYSGTSLRDAAQQPRPKLEHQVLKAAATGTRESHFIGSKQLRTAATQVHRCDANQRKGAASIAPQRAAR